MKKVIIAVVFITASLHLRAQNSSPESQASQIAQKMKDSLSISEQLRGQIESVTVRIQRNQASLKKQYPGTSALNYYLRMVEDDRDSLYQGVLPQDKYLLYKQKKPNLISTN